MFKAIFTDLDGVIRHWNNQDIHKVEEKNGLSRGFLFDHAFSEKLLLPTIIGKQSHDQWIQRVEINLRKKAGATCARSLLTSWLETTYTIDGKLLDDYECEIPNVKLILVTNATDHLDADLEASSLNKRFEVIVNSSEIGHAKPDHQFFEKALSLVNVIPSEVIFIDDSLVNVKAAEELGFTTIHFHSRQQTKYKLRQLSRNKHQKIVESV